MSITYPIDFPAQVAANEHLSLTRRQAQLVSPFNFVAQTVNTASQWELSWSWPRMRLASAAYIDAWVLSLKGQIGSFRYYPVMPFGPCTLTGKAVAQDAYGYNDTLRAGGWPAGQPTTLRAGQFVTVGNQLLRITDASALADANGQITISFAPELRKTYPAGTALNFVRPYGVFALTVSEGLGYSVDPDRAPEYSAMSAREVVNA